MKCTVSLAYLEYSRTYLVDEYLKTHLHIPNFQVIQLSKIKLFGQFALEWRCQIIDATLFTSINVKVKQPPSHPPTLYIQCMSITQSTFYNICEFFKQ